MTLRKTPHDKLERGSPASGIPMWGIVDVVDQNENKV
jgi:hypothetical protein